MNEDEERVSADDFNWYYPPEQYDVPASDTNGHVSDEDLAAIEKLVVRFRAVSEFAATDEPNAEPLLGTPDATVLPVGGTLMLYGTGGAGKTALTIDAIAAMATGGNWLGLSVPKPVKIAIIENEGPRGMFRKQLRAKLTVKQFDGAVLEEPWAAFDLSSQMHREALVAAVAEMETDLVVAGPVSTIGMVGGGTADEINRFSALIDRVRSELGRPLAFWLIHHENRAGQVSGAWERVPDVLAHVAARGNGHTRVFWQKVRWSSELHQTAWNLTWADGHSFTKDESEVITEDRVVDEMIQWVLIHGGCSSKDMEEAVPGNSRVVRSVRDRLLHEGVIVNGVMTKRKDGKPTAYSLWHRDDENRPLVLDDDIPDW